MTAKNALTMALMGLLLCGCASGTTRIKLETVLNQEMPNGWEWVVSTSGQRRIMTMSDLIHIEQPGKRPTPPSFSLNCPDALAELRELDRSLLVPRLAAETHKSAKDAQDKEPKDAKDKDAKKKDNKDKDVKDKDAKDTQDKESRDAEDKETPQDREIDPLRALPALKYFNVQNASFRFVDFASNLGSVSTSAGAEVARSELSVQYQQGSMLVHLAILYTEYMISAQDRYLECVRSSLTDAGLHGTYQVPSDMLVGGMVILTFAAKNKSGKTAVRYGDLAHAEVEINLNDVKISFYQWGSTRARLKGSSLLDPLRADAPDPLAAVGILRGNVAKHGVVALRRTELRL